MNIVLPRRNTREIPKEERQPERVLGLVGIDALNITEMPVFERRSPSGP